MVTSHNPVTDEDVRRLQRDGEWFQREFQNLRPEYQGQFVAIYGREVVDAAESRTALRDSMEDSNDLNPRDALIEYVPEPSHSLQMVRNIPTD